MYLHHRLYGSRVPPGIHASATYFVPGGAANPFTLHRQMHRVPPTHPAYPLGPYHAPSRPYWTPKMRSMPPPYLIFSQGGAGRVIRSFNPRRIWKGSRNRSRRKRNIGPSYNAGAGAFDASNALTSVYAADTRRAGRQRNRSSRIIGPSMSTIQTSANQFSSSTSYSPANPSELQAKRKRHRTSQVIGGVMSTPRTKQAYPPFVNRTASQEPIAKAPLSSSSGTPAKISRRSPSLSRLVGSMQRRKTALEASQGARGIPAKSQDPKLKRAATVAAPSTTTSRKGKASTVIPPAPDMPALTRTLAVDDQGNAFAPPPKQAPVPFPPQRPSATRRVQQGASAPSNPLPIAAPTATSTSASASSSAASASGPLHVPGVPTVRIPGSVNANELPQRPNPNFIPLEGDPVSILPSADAQSIHLGIVHEHQPGRKIGGIQITSSKTKVFDVKAGGAEFYPSDRLAPPPSRFGVGADKYRNLPPADGIIPKAGVFDNRHLPAIGVPSPQIPI